MASLEMLIFNIFLLGDENHGNLLNSIGISNSIVLFEMRSIVQIVKDVLDGSCMREEIPLSEIDEQMGMNLPYLFSYEFP